MHVRSSPASIFRLLIGLSIVIAGLFILLSQLLPPILPGFSFLFSIGLVGAAFLTTLQNRHRKKDHPPRSTLAGEG